MQKAPLPGLYDWIWLRAFLRFSGFPENGGKTFFIKIK